MAGLAAAWELARRGHRPLVLERSPRPGGVVLTEHTDGFVIDAGPDSLLVQKPAAVALCRELGLGDRLFPTLTPRTAYIAKHGRLIALPEASVLGVPTRVVPFITTPLFSPLGKLRMALEVAIPPRRSEDDESIASFMRRRFGEEMVRWLAEPLLAGIHAGDVERLSMRALFPRLVEAERRSGSVIRSLRSAQVPRSTDGAFLSLPGGIGELATTLAGALPPGTIRTGVEVSRIEGRGPFDVHLASGDGVTANSLIVATPAWASASLLAGVDERLADLCRGIRYQSTATVAIALRREQVRHPLRGSGFVVPRKERRTIMAGSFVSSKWPGRAPEGYVLLRGFVGGAYDPAALETSDEHIARAVFEDLAARLSITGSPAFARVYRWPRATAQHDVGHLDVVAEIEARLAALPGLFLTGSAFRGSGIPDVVADARQVAASAAAFAERAS